MNDELKKAVRKSQVALQSAFTKERGAFKALLLKNPNYFGNLEASPFTPVKAISGNTFYEELVCVGFEPQQEQLEAVVYVYQPSGYGGGICGPGSTEFVRFYLSFDNGASWQDQGLTGFQTFDIPAGTEGGKRLEYAASLKVNPPNRFCIFDHLIRVRAILSWNNPPPANQPNWKPVWGNVMERTIQTEPRRLFPFGDLVAAAELKLPKLLTELADPDQLVAAKPKALAAAELATLYRDRGVPLQRFAYKELHAFVSGKSQLAAESFAALLPGIDIDLDIDDILAPSGDGNTSFEELHCVGLDPNAPNVLVATIEVKKSSGYSGGPCTDGSREYVTFWADFDGNGSFETCLGTASVRVYDLPNVPADGIHYAVRLPVDLAQYRRPCTSGPVVVRIRAVLSWAVPAPCANPNHVPTWGNREETLIHVAPGQPVVGGRIAILGGIPTSMIDSVGGVTTPDAVFATNNLAPDALGRPCPFAARVAAQGAPLPPGFSYRVEVVPAAGGTPVPVVKKLTLVRADGTTYQHAPDPVTGRFAYVPFDDNVNGLLAEWDSTGDELWIVRLLSYDPADVLLAIDTHRVQLDNTGPLAAVEITTGTGNCGKFAIGEVIDGSFVARDQWFGGFSLGVEPAINPPGTFLLTPTSGTVQTPAAGSAWSLDTNGVPDTAGMQSCGYVLRVVVADRAIVNSQSVGHHASASVGLCLEMPEAG